MRIRIFIWICPLSNKPETFFHVVHPTLYNFFEVSEGGLRSSYFGVSITAQNIDIILPVGVESVSNCDI